MRKILVSCCSVAALLVLAGCGEDDTATTSGDATTAIPETTETATITDDDAGGEMEEVTGSVVESSPSGTAEEDATTLVPADESVLAERLEDQAADAVPDASGDLASREGPDVSADDDATREPATAPATTAETLPRGVVEGFGSEAVSSPPGEAASDQDEADVEGPADEGQRAASGAGIVVPGTDPQDGEVQVAQQAGQSMQDTSLSATPETALRALQDLRRIRAELAASAGADSGGETGTAGADSR